MPPRCALTHLLLQHWRHFKCQRVTAASCRDTIFFFCSKGLKNKQPQDQRGPIGPLSQTPLLPSESSVTVMFHSTQQFLSKVVKRLFGFRNFGCCFFFLRGRGCTRQRGEVVVVVIMTANDNCDQAATRCDTRKTGDQLRGLVTHSREERQLKSVGRREAAELHLFFFFLFRKEDADKRH